MNFLKIIQTLESLLLEFILLLLFLPKTLFRVLRNPGWIPAYLEQEFQREEHDRFNDYSSPMAMFLFLGAIPIFIFYAYSSGETISIPFMQGSNKYQLTMSEYFVFTSLLMLIGPLYMSLLNLFIKRLPFNKIELRRIILMQAYVWTVPYLFYVTGGVIGQLSCRDKILCFGIDESISGLAIGLIWLLISEIVLFRKEIGKTLLKTIAIVTVALFVYLLLFFLAGNFIEASLRELD